MACYVGKDGIVTIDSDAVGEITNFSIEETAEVLECTSMGDTYREYKVSFKNWTASIDTRWDPDDSGQVNAVVGATVTVAFYPEGNTAADTKITGSAIIIGVTETAAFDGLVERSLSLQGTGALTRTTV